MSSDSGGALWVYNNSLADEIKLYKEPHEATFPLLFLLSVVLFVPTGSWRRRGIVCCLRLLGYWCLLCRQSSCGYFERICTTPLISAPWAGKKRILLAKEKQPLSYSWRKEQTKNESMLEKHCFPSCLPPPSPQCTLRYSEILEHFKGGVEICEWKKIREISNISLTVIVLSIKKCKLHHVLSKSNRLGISSWYFKVTDSVVAEV